MFEQTKKEFLKEIDFLLKESKTEQAIKQMNQSEFRENTEVLMRLGNAYIQIEEYDLALRTFQFLSNFELDERGKQWVSFNLSIILRQTGQIDQAKKLLQGLLRRCPEDASYLCELGNCYFDSKQNYLAEKYFIKAIENIKNLNSEYSKALIYSYAAWFFKKTEKMAVAIKLFKKALLYLPIHKDYLLWLGDCYCGKEMKKTAKKLYLKAKEYYPEDNRIQDYVEKKLEWLDEE